jgi:hypothetical protein
MDDTYNKWLNELKILENNFNFLNKYFLNGITLSGVDDGGIFIKNKLYVYLDKLNYIEIIKLEDNVFITTKSENILICLEIINIIKLSTDYFLIVNDNKYFMKNNDCFKIYNNIIENLNKSNMVKIIFQLTIDEPKISIWPESPNYEDGYLWYLGLKKLKL